MKLTKSILKQIIQEELKAVLSEDNFTPQYTCKDGTPCAEGNCFVRDEMEGWILPLEEYLKKFPEEPPHPDEIHCRY